MSDTSSETSSICSRCFRRYRFDAPPPRRTLLEKEFECVLDRLQHRVSKRRRSALCFQNFLDQSQESNEPDQDINLVVADRHRQVCSLIKQYEKDNGIVHIPFLSEEEVHLHQVQDEFHREKTKLLQDKLGSRSDDSHSTSERPRWYRTSKDFRKRRLQRRIEDRQHERRNILEKEKFALDWQCNFLRLNFLPFFLDPDNTAFQDDIIRPKSTNPKMARRLLVTTIQHHPTRSNLFDYLSAYDIAKLFYVLFPNDPREAAQSFLGDLQVRQWMNPLRDVFGPDQLSYISSSIQQHVKSRISVVLFGPDAWELQSRIWDVPGHEARRASQPDHKLRIFYTYRHDDSDKADRFFFDIDDFLTNGIEMPKPDGEPYRCLISRSYQFDPIFMDTQAYGRSLRPSSPDPHITAEYIWSENALYWAPSVIDSVPGSSSTFRDFWGLVNELPAGLELRGGVDHGLSSEVIRFAATSRTDIPRVFDGRSMQHILEIPFLTYTPPSAPTPPTSGSYTLTRKLLTWNPSLPEPRLQPEISQRKLARRDHWRETIHRTRHRVYHTHGGRWHRRALMVRETVRFQGTFARMVVLDPKFLWQCIQEGEITVFWIDLSRWFGND